MAENKKNIMVATGWYLYHDGAQFRLVNSTAAGDIDCGSAPSLQSVLNLYLDQRAIREHIGKTTPVSFASAFAVRNGYADDLAADESGRIERIYQSVLWGEGL